MTEFELDELLRTNPTLYHMAELGSWPQIREHGLLSTTALLDLYEVPDGERLRIEHRHRPTKIKITHPNFPCAVIRDQIPMDDAGLRRCLPAEMAPPEWYTLLNGKVFFWLSRKRLLKMLQAGAYRDDAHDVLEADARAVVESYRPAIWLTPMNTGCTKPYPHKRGPETFARIPDHPYTDRPRSERAVELAIDYAVPDIERFVTRVAEMKSNEEVRTIFSRAS